MPDQASQFICYALLLVLHHRHHQHQHLPPLFVCLFFPLPVTPCPFSWRVCPKTKRACVFAGVLSGVWNVWPRDKDAHRKRSVSGESHPDLAAGEPQGHRKPLRQCHAEIYRGVWLQRAVALLRHTLMPFVWASSVSGDFHSTFMFLYVISLHIVICCLDKHWWENEERISIVIWSFHTDSSFDIVTTLEDV